MNFTDAITDIRHLGHERGHVFDNELRWLFAVDGDENSIPSRILRLLPAGRVLLHNHPGGDAGPSRSDLGFAHRVQLSALFVVSGDVLYGALGPFSLFTLGPRWADGVYSDHYLSYAFGVASGVDVFWWPLQ